MTDERLEAGQPFIRFSEQSDYKLADIEQDIRNLPLIRSDGTELGLIDDLLIDEAAERVAAVSLGDGRQVPVEPLEIDGRKVIDHGQGHRHASHAKIYEAKTVRTS